MTPTVSLIRSWTVPLPGYGSTSRAGTSAALLAAANLARSRAKAMNWSLLADGALSHRTSTMAATRAALSKWTPMRPSAVSLPSRFACILLCWLRSHSMALSMSPPLCSSAFLHSPIGMSVRSRSCLTCCGVTAAMSVSSSKFEVQS